MATAPVIKNVNDLLTFRIGEGDTVKLTHLTGPSEGSPTSVFFEVWEPLGSQPDNSHPDSVEIFIVLSGRASAVSDEHSVELRAGDVVVLPAGSVHHIRNVSETERLYTVTIMANDLGSMERGFEDLVTSGSADTLSEDDKRALFSGLSMHG